MGSWLGTASNLSVSSYLVRGPYKSALQPCDIRRAIYRNLGHPRTGPQEHRGDTVQRPMEFPDIQSMCGQAAGQAHLYSLPTARSRFYCYSTSLKGCHRSIDVISHCRHSASELVTQDTENAGSQDFIVRSDLASPIASPWLPTLISEDLQNHYKCEACHKQDFKMKSHPGIPTSNNSS